jgi:hypothetical protein
MTPEVLIVAKFLLWLKRQGVGKIVIPAMLDREPDKVYETEDQMLDLAAKWFASNKK